MSSTNIGNTIYFDSIADSGGKPIAFTIISKDTARFTGNVINTASSGELSTSLCTTPKEAWQISNDCKKAITNEESGDILLDTTKMPDTHSVKIYTVATNKLTQFAGITPRHPKNRNVIQRLHLRPLEHLHIRPLEPNSSTKRRLDFDFLCQNLTPEQMRNITTFDTKKRRDSTEEVSIEQARKNKVKSMLSNAYFTQDSLQSTLTIIACDDEDQIKYKLFNAIEKFFDNNFSTLEFTPSEWQNHVKKLLTILIQITHPIMNSNEINRFPLMTTTVHNFDINSALHLAKDFEQAQAHFVQKEMELRANVILTNFNWFESPFKLTDELEWIKQKIIASKLSETYQVNLKELKKCLIEVGIEQRNNKHKLDQQISATKQAQTPIHDFTRLSHIIKTILPKDIKASEIYSLTISIINKVKSELTRKKIPPLSYSPIREGERDLFFYNQGNLIQQLNDSVMGLANDIRKYLKEEKSSTIEKSVLLKNKGKSLIVGSLSQLIIDAVIEKSEQNEIEDVTKTQSEPSISRRNIQLGSDFFLSAKPTGRSQSEPSMHNSTPR